MNEHPSCEPISSSAVFIGGLASGSHTITVNVFFPHEASPVDRGGSANKTALHEYTSARVLASDAVVVDVVGPGWHGAASIEKLTYADRGLTGHDHGGSAVGQIFMGGSSHDIGDGIGDSVDDPSAGMSGNYIWHYETEKWGRSGDQGGSKRQTIGVDKIAGVLRVAIVSSTLEGHNQNIAFEKLSHSLPRSRWAPLHEMDFSCSIRSGIEAPQPTLRSMIELKSTLPQVAQGWEYSQRHRITPLQPTI